MEPRRHRRIVRIVRWLGIVAAAALLAQNLVINLAVPGWVSDEERTVSWELAWMIVPGRVHMHGFRVSDRTDVHRWWLEIDRVSAWVALSRLFQGELVVSSADGSGVRFSIEEHPEPREDDEEDAEEERDTSDLWRFEFQWVDAHPVESICIVGVCTEGPGRVRGRFELAPLEHFEVGPASYEPNGATVSREGVVVAEDVQGRLEVTIHRVDIQETDGLEHFEQVDADARLRAELSDLPGLLVDVPERGRPGAGRGSARLDASVRRGVIAPDSEVDADVVGAAFRLGEHRAWLAGRLRARAGDQELTIRLLSGRVTARSADADQMQLELGDVTGELTGISTNLADPSVTPRVEVEAREGTLSDARLVAPWLPESLVPVRGTGAVEGRGHWRPDTGEVRASLDLRAVDWRWRIASVDMRSALRVQGELHIAEGGRLSLAGSSVQLDELSIRESEEDVTRWSGTVTVGEALAVEGARLAHPLSLRMRDARPVLALLEATVDPPDLLQRVAEMEGLRGRVSLIVPREGAVRFEDLSLSGDGLDVEGWLHLGDPTEYSLFFDAGLLSLGVVSRGGETSFHPFGAGM